MNAQPVVIRKPTFPPEADGPRMDPLTYAAKCAARRFVLGQPMEKIDWEALEAMASSELRELDLTTDF